MSRRAELLSGHQPPADETSQWHEYDVSTATSNEVAINWTEASALVDNKASHRGEHCSAGFKVQDGDMAAH